MPRTLVLIRGVQGSGKSTLAKMYANLGYKHFEADMFFIDKDGVYRWDANRIYHAHKWCQEQADIALFDHGFVVVSNTFVKLKEMKPYLESAAAKQAVVQEIICWGRFENEHGVPEDFVNAKREAFEFNKSYSSNRNALELLQQSEEMDTVPTLDGKPAFYPPR